MTMTSSDLDVRTRNFEGFEAAIFGFVDSPSVDDGFGGQIIPESLRVIHYANGYWQSPFGTWTLVTVAGALDSGPENDYSARTWKSNAHVESQQFTSIPTWIVDLVRERIGLDLLADL